MGGEAVAQVTPVVALQNNTLDLVFVLGLPAVGMTTFGYLSAIDRTHVAKPGRNQVVSTWFSIYFFGDLRNENE